MARNDPQINLRLPVALKERLEAAALESHRSFKAEVVHRLELTVDQDDQAAESNERYHLLERLAAGEIDRSQVPDWPPDEEGDPGPDLNDAPHDEVRPQRVPTNIAVTIKEVVKSAIMEAVGGDELRRLRDELAAQREALLGRGDASKPASDVEESLRKLGKDLDALRDAFERRDTVRSEPFTPRVVGDEPQPTSSVPTRSAPAPRQPRKGGKGEK